MIVIRVQAQDNNTNGYLVCLFQMVSRLKYFIKNSQVISRSTHKWYPISGTHEDKKGSRNGFLLINPTSGSILEDSFKWYHIYTWYQSCKTMVPQVILNFKWSSNEECIPHYKSSSLSNGWPMKWFRGRRHTNWYQGQRSYVWYLKKLYKWCHSNNQVMSIKNARFKPQPSTPNAYLCINKKHTFYGNWWQRGRDCTKIWKLWDWDCTRGRDKI